MWFNDVLLERQGEGARLRPGGRHGGGRRRADIGPRADRAAVVRGGGHTARQGQAQEGVRVARAAEGTGEGAQAVAPVEARGRGQGRHPGGAARREEHARDSGRPGLRPHDDLARGLKCVKISDTMPPGNPLS